MRRYILCHYFRLLRTYFASLIGDQEAFVSGVLAVLDKQLPAETAEQARTELETRRKKLLGKRDRYRELYANDLLSMDELKEKLSGITEELKALEADLEKTARTSSSEEEIICRYRQEITRFLELETITNMDMRGLLDHISVSRDGNVKVVLKKLEDMT